MNGKKGGDGWGTHPKRCRITDGVKSRRKRAAQATIDFVFSFHFTSETG
jgi:hypothetical protein